MNSVYYCSGGLGWLWVLALTLPIGSISPARNRAFVSEQNRPNRDILSCSDVFDAGVGRVCTGIAVDRADLVVVGIACYRQGVHIACSCGGVHVAVCTVFAGGSVDFILHCSGKCFPGNYRLTVRCTVRNCDLRLCAVAGTGNYCAEGRGDAAAADGDGGQTGTVIKCGLINGGQSGAAGEGGRSNAVRKTLIRFVFMSPSGFNSKGVFIKQ